MTDVKTDVVVKPISQMEDVRTKMLAMQPQFQMALPPQISPEKFVRVVMTAIQTNPYLLELDRQSLFGAAIKAAQDGLLPDGKEGAMVPFKNKVTWSPMVSGILKKVRNSGELSSITAQMIFENDQFKYFTDDTGEHLEHTPLIFGVRGKPIGVYALAKTKDGGVYVEVLNSDQVMAIRATSQAKSGPWTGPFEHEMWKKSAIRRLSKRLPMSTDLEDVIKRDDEMYDLKLANANYIDKGKKLEKMLENKTESREEGNGEEKPKVIGTGEETPMFDMQTIK